jgi:hypothetical protein
VAPINVNDVFQCSYRRPSSCRRTKRYSRSFSGAPSGGRPFPADRAVNAVFPLFLWRSFRRPPFSGRPRRQCGIPALPLALLPTAAHLRPTAPPIPPATSARAYRAATDTPLGQKNHQKWCLSPGSVDLCNLSLFRRCTRTTLLTKRQIRRSESRSEEITAVQASTRLHAPPEGSARLPTRFTRSHVPPW